MTETSYDPYNPLVPEKAAKKKSSSSKVVPIKPGPADDAVAAVNLAKFQRAAETLASANGVYRNVVKHVEAKGIHMKAAKRAVAIAKSDDRAEIVEELKRLTEYLAILGVPFTREQLDLFRVEEPRTPGTDKATAQGRYAGIMGHGKEDNPYAIDSEQGQAWMAAWHAGGEERDLILALEPAEGSELIKVTTILSKKPPNSGQRARRPAGSLSRQSI
jgi:ribosome modulation factor